MTLSIRRGGIGSITNTLEQIQIQHCPKCDSVGIRDQRTILGKRIYTKEELDNSSWHGKLPPDHNKWLQCRFCNYIVHKKNVMQEGKLISEIEIGSPNIHALKKRNLRQHERDRLSVENLDPELKRELSGGKKLVSYSKR
jgi:hypothetical protein